MTRDERSDWLRVAVVINNVIFIAPRAVGNEGKGGGVKILRLSKFVTPIHMHTHTRVHALVLVHVWI